MTFFSSITGDKLFAAGYILSCGMLNVIALFISSFYRRRLHQSSPRVGFIIAILFSLLFVLLLFTGAPGSVAVGVISVVALLGCGIASSFSILVLFLTMRSIRK